MQTAKKINTPEVYDPLGILKKKVDIPEVDEPLGVTEEKIATPEIAASKVTAPEVTAPEVYDPLNLNVDTAPEVTAPEVYDPLNLNVDTASTAVGVPTTASTSTTVGEPTTIGTPPLDTHPILQSALRSTVPGMIAEKTFSNIPSNIDKAILSGLQSSIPGMMTRKAAAEPFEPKGQTERFFQQLAQLLPELPIYGVGGVIGSTGGPVGAAGGAFGFAAGLRKVLVDKYTKGEVKSSKEFIDRVNGAVKETVKGYVTGATVGTVGKYTPELAKFPAEIATMTAVPSALEGRLPEPQDFQDAFLLLGTLKVVGMTPTKLKEVYAKHGKLPLEVVNEVKQGTLDKEIAAELGIHPPIEETTKDFVRSVIEEKKLVTKTETPKIEEPELYDPLGIIEKSGTTRTETAKTKKNTVEARHVTKAESFDTFKDDTVNAKIVTPDKDVKAVKQVPEEHKTNGKEMTIKQAETERLLKQWEEREVAEGAKIPEMKKAGNIIAETLKTEGLEIKYEKYDTIVGKNVFSVTEKGKETSFYGKDLTDTRNEYTTKTAAYDEIPTAPKISQADLTAKEIKTAKSSRDTKDTLKNITANLNKQEIIKGAFKKESRLAIKAEADAIEARLTEDFGELTGYETAKGFQKQQAVFAQTIMNANFKYATRIAMGLEMPPEGVMLAPIYTGVSYRAIRDNNINLIKKLATESSAPERLSTYGQEIKAADIRTAEDPIKNIQEVVKERKKRLKREGKKPLSAAKIDKLGKELETAEENLNKAEKSLTESVTKHTQKVKREGTTTSTKKKSVGLSKLTQSHKVLNEMKQKLTDLDKVAKPKKELEQIALDKLKTRLKNEIKHYEKNLEELRFAEKEKIVPKLTKEIEDLKEEHARVKKIYTAAEEASGTITKQEVAEIVKMSEKTIEKKEKQYNPETEKWSSPKSQKDYGVTKRAYVNYINYLKFGERTIPEMLKDRWQEAKVTWKENKAQAIADFFKDAIYTTSDISISMAASWDNSFVGRQGRNTFFTHPTVWADMTLKSFGDIYKSLATKEGAKAVKDVVMAEIYSRPNYMNGNYHKAKLFPKSEEQFPTSLPGRLPLGVGRVFNAAENAFIFSAARARMNTFDLLHGIMKRQGIDVNNKVELQEVGKLINSITGRGDAGKLGESKVVRLVLWAPRLLRGNWDVLTAHTGGATLHTAFTRKQAKINLAEIVFSTAAIAAVADVLKPGCVELNPISSDFLKIRVGNTVYDLTSGTGSIITLLARVIARRTKSTKTGEISSLVSGKYYKRNLFDVGLDFLVNKTTPTARAVIDASRGRTFTGKKPTIATALVSTQVPITIQNFIEEYHRKAIDKSTAETVGNVLDIFGISSNTFITEPSDKFSVKKESLNVLRDKYKKEYGKKNKNILTERKTLQQLRKEYSEG